MEQTMTKHLAIWRITPVASPEDGAWRGHVIWKELQIIASSAGAALHEAGRHFDVCRGVSDAVSVDGRQVCSGFSDTKLYRVDRSETPTNAPPGTVAFEELL
jgi:hypothetical protein